MKRYDIIKTQSRVVIGPGYPYSDIPELPYCKELIINNSNVRAIANQPNCEFLIVNSCITSRKSRVPYNIGHLNSIGNLPKCTKLTIHANSLETIGNIDNCIHLTVYNESGREFSIKSGKRLSVLLRSHKGDIIYSGHDKMDFSDTVKELLDHRLKISNIDFKNTCFPMSSNIVLNVSNEINLNLKFADFSKHILNNITFHNISLRDSHFKKTKLTNVMFENCELDFVDFRDMNLSNTYFKNCTFFCTKIAFCNISQEQSHIFNVPSEERRYFGINILPQQNNLYGEDNLKKTSWRGSPSFYLFRINGWPVNLPQTDISINDYFKLLARKKYIENLDLSLTKLFTDKSLDLSHIDFRDCFIKNVIFQNCDLTDSNFDSAKIENIKFINCKLSGTRFSNIDLTNTLFINCYLGFTNFNGSIILPELVNKILLNKNYSDCRVQMKNGECIKLAEFASPSRNINVYTDLWNNGTHLITLKNKDQILFAGSEKECYNWFVINHKENNITHKISHLDNWIEQNIEDKQTLTQILSQVYTIVKENTEGKENLDQDLAALIKRVSNTLGTEQNLVTLCNIISDIDKESLLLKLTQKAVQHCLICKSLKNNLKIESTSLSSSQNKISH